MARRTAAFIWNGFVLHIGDGARSSSHVHSALELVFGIGSPVGAQSADGRWVEGGCVLIGSNVPHAFRSDRFAMLWIEPESDAGRRLTQAYCRHDPIAAISARNVDALGIRASAILDDPSSCDAAWAFASDALRSVAADLPRGRVVHPAIRKALRLIEERPQFKISAKELAAAVELSESRLGHLFREHMGVPLRRYLMWQRVRHAVVELVRGRPATQVALDAGFTDAAHLNRVLRMMLALRPSDFHSAPNLTLHVCSRPD